MAEEPKHALMQVDRNGKRLDCGETISDAASIRGRRGNQDFLKRPLRGGRVQACVCVFRKLPGNAVTGL